MSHTTMMQTETMAETNTNQSPWRNPWVIGWLAMIIVVLGMNAFMIFMAYVSSPGLVNEQYYDRGQNYYQTVEQREVVGELGWEIKMDLPSEPLIGQQFTVRVVGTDKVGLPLELDKASINLFRPADASADFGVEMDTEAGGRYSTQLSLPLKGTWDLIATLKKGDFTHTLARRLTVTAP